jgi:coenzyme PQQ synthesis protein D (PqqD)
VTDAPSPDDRALLAARLAVAEHAVQRPVGEETVIFDATTEEFILLNATAAQMVDEVEAADSVGAALDRLALRYGLPAATLRPDLLSGCRELVGSGLLVRRPGA